MKIVKNWILPLFIALALFIVVRPAVAQTLSLSNPNSVGTEAVGGFTQVYYEVNGSRNFITSGNLNSRMPAFFGGYIAYVTDVNGAGQIFLYDVNSAAKTQLTFLGTNLNPKVDDKGRVVWEGWDGNTWQVFFFDGKSVRQLTSGDTTVNPGFDGDFITYGRRDIAGTWRAVIYSVKEDKSVDVTIGEGARNPKIKNGNIYLAADSLAEEKFPLSVNDLFLLSLTPLTGTQSAEASSSADILNELSASPSPVPEIPLASESATPIPQSTSSPGSEATPTPGT